MSDKQAEEPAPTLPDKEPETTAESAAAPATAEALPPAAGAVPELGEPDREGRSWKVTAIAWGATALLLLVTAGLIGVIVKRQGKALEKPPVRLANVEIATVAGVEYDETLVLPTRLVADREAVVSSELAGSLVEWLVEEGAQVTAGTPVARLDTATLEAQRAELQAQEGSMRAAIAAARQRVELAKVALRNSQHALRSARLVEEGAAADLALSEKEFARSDQLTRDDVQTEAELDTARNRLTQARIALDQAKERVSQAETAVRSAEVSVAEAEASVAEDQARLEVTRAAIASVQVSLDKTTLHAPIDGRLEAYLAQPGEVVAPGQEMARIYDLRHVRAIVDVADRYVPFLDRDNATVDQFVLGTMPGARRRIAAEVVFPGLPKLTGGTHPGLTFPAELYLVAQASDPASNTFRVELRMENPGGALKQGIIGQARISYLTYPEAIVIPMRAVQVSDRGPRVLTVQQESDGGWQVKVRDIVPVSIQGDHLLVSGGLDIGDKLMVAGGKGLVDGERVNVIIIDGEPAAEQADGAAASSGDPEVALPERGKPESEVEL